MKKRVFGSLVCALLGSFIVQTVRTEAAPYPKDTSSTGNIEFIMDDEGKTDPLNPENPDPEKPITPTTPGGSTEGALRLDHVSNFDFGSDNKISSKAQSYYAVFEPGIDKDGEEIVFPSFFQVTDARGGTKGWKVTISNNGIFSVANDPTKKIEHAKITFDTIGVHSGSGITTTTEFPEPTTTAVEIDSSKKTLVTAKSAQKQGYGTWVFPIGNSQTKTSGQGVDGNDNTNPTAPVDNTKKNRNPGVKLTLPQGAVVEADVEYSTDLIWELEDTF